LSSLDSNAEVLSDFGLTPYQARVYLAAVQLGLASVSKIAKVSRVRREEVYRTLPTLENMGLTERVLGKPFLIRAIPVEDALSFLIEREQDSAHKRMVALTARREEFVRRFKAEAKGIGLEEEKDQFILVPEREATIRRCVSMINNAKKTIDIVTSRTKLAKCMFIHSDHLRKCVKRGTKVRIVTEQPEDEEDTLPLIIERCIPGNSFELRYVDTLQGHFMIVDTKEAFVTTSTDANFAESPGLWTNSSSLTALLQKNFEDIWHTSRKWTDVPYSEAKMALRFTCQLKPSDHAIFVYDSQKTKHNVLFNYIKNAFESGEAAIYVCSEESTDQIREAMKRFGIKVEEQERKGALRIIDYTDFYIIEGKFSSQNTQRLWSEFYEDALSKGFKGLRVTGEVACFFKHGLARELSEYEKSLHRVLDIPMVAICAYNARVLSENKDVVNLYNELVRSHGTVLFEGTNRKLGRIEIRKV